MKLKKKLATDYVKNNRRMPIDKQDLEEFYTAGFEAAVALAPKRFLSSVEEANGLTFPQAIEKIEKDLGQIGEEEVDVDESEYGSLPS
jgi:hypothetical protein